LPLEVSDGAAAAEWLAAPPARKSYIDADTNTAVRSAHSGEIKSDDVNRPSYPVSFCLGGGF
jgi:hypothetical protein